MSVFEKLVLRLLKMLLYRSLYRKDGIINTDNQADSNAKKLLDETENFILQEEK
jgi:hypothetical protein